MIQWIRIFLVSLVLTAMSFTYGSGRLRPFLCIRRFLAYLMVLILKKMLQIKKHEKNENILLIQSSVTLLTANCLALFWTVQLLEKFGLLSCLSTNRILVRIFMNFRRNSFRLLFFLNSLLQTSLQVLTSFSVN